MIGRIKGKILYCAKTDRGLERKVNQDAVAAFIHDSLGLFVVSDGMGGHSNGELASKEILLAFDDFWRNIEKLSRLPDFMTLVRMIQQVIENVNGSIFKKYNQHQICGATVVVLFVFRDCYAVFSVGDSRVYTYNQRKLMTLTVDDIWDNLPATINSYTQDEISIHKNKGKLVQAVGIRTKLNVYIKTDRVTKGQVFMLCSDGLFKFCEERVIQKGLKKIKSEEAMQKSVDSFWKNVYEHGAGDNLSTIIVRVV